ncbi:MAG: uroporphyrinogen decarboxylase [Proteobacteria bacterium]|nr:MAG: uroporphyrinogen decarboxylase [Pseudomonadota bacterium]
MSSIFIDACYGRQVPRTPIWLMRQAGRYLPEYRALRIDHRMLELCRNPALVAEVTWQPLKRFPLDAAILFSDITVPFLALDIHFDIAPGIGPVVENPLRSNAQIAALSLEGLPSKLAFVSESISLLKSELKVPLIGFAGAPFTLATYLVEGKPSRDYKTVRKLIYSEPDLWAALMNKLTDVTLSHLRLQAAAGVDALQIFDSWVGVLPKSAYQAAILPYMMRLWQGLSDLAIPLIHFGLGTWHLLTQIQTFKPDVVGVDSTISIKSAAEGPLKDTVIQGNLDPACMFATKEALTSAVRSVLEEGRAAKGHIFNLGHGVLPETPIDSVSTVVELVQEGSAR